MRVACIPECDVPNSPDQTCQLPTLSQVSPASGPTGHATLLTVHGSGFFAAGDVISYTKQVLGLDTLFTHTALPRCVFGTGASRQETTATVTSSERLVCRSPPTALVGCYPLVVSMDVCDFDSGILDACPAERVAGLAFSYLPRSQVRVRVRVRVS